ncbi:MAG: hypothetical protein LBM95_05310 [Lactobacillales bacterium]|jgi:hypothetical protein|nr:hypothetical protein [Lactobacillales bacterium]
MKIDFHYYATNLAARLAGFSNEEAYIIAYSSQFVDDLTEKLVPDSPIITNYTTLHVTHMSVMEDWSENNWQKLREVYQVFHFVPGNEIYEITYQGAKQYLTWKFQEENEEQLKELTLPSSPLVKEIVTSAVTSRNLYRIGLAAHAYADSFAHQGFAGVPWLFLNEVVNGVNLPDGSRSFKFLSRADFSNANDSLEQLKFYANPRMPMMKNQVYLGHNRLGNIVDYSCLKFSYTPYWHSEAGAIIRENPKEFTQCFFGLVE